MRGKLYWKNAGKLEFLCDVTDLKMVPASDVMPVVSKVPTITFEHGTGKIVSVFDGKEHHASELVDLPTPTENLKRLQRETGCVQFTDDQLCELELTGRIGQQPNKRIDFGGFVALANAKLAARRGRQG